MRTLPDHLRKGMKLVIVGCNPSESSVRVGHYYAGRVNEFGVGLTDLVKRPTKGIEELKREEYAEGRIVLSQKLEEFAPHVVAFNGKLTYEQFAQRKCKFGIQKELLYGARVYVLPSTSGANATGRSEKLRHFRKLAQLVARIGKEHESRRIRASAWSSSPVRGAPFARAGTSARWVRAARPARHMNWSRCCAPPCKWSSRCAPCRSP